LDSNKASSITSWESLLSKLYNKFFPISKVNESQKEISSFTQEEDEKFFESWERFKELLIKCPPHGYEKWRLIQFFYQGLTQPNRSMIESMNREVFLRLTRDLAYKALDKLSNNSQQLDFSSYRNKSTPNPKKGCIYELKGEAELNIKIDTLTKMLDTLNVGQSVNVANTFTADSCSICASPMHQHRIFHLCQFFLSTRRNK
jgi:hypothetical protein